jgi:hypothetical protein
MKGFAMDNTPPQWITTIWNVLKTIGPWLTGGLAGAVLTYTLNQRNARRKQPRLLVRTNQVDYSISSDDASLKALRVSYEGHVFEKLVLFELDVENVSSRSVKMMPFLVQLQTDVRVVDQSSLIRPLHRDALWQRQSNQESAYIWDPGECKPGDSARLRLLVTPSGTIDWSFRGDDEVEVLSSDRGSTRTFESDIRNALAWIAGYLLVGSFPFMSDAPRGLYLIMSAPYIVKLAVRWRIILRNSRRVINAAPVVVADKNASISMVYDAHKGQSVIDIKPDKALSP